VRADTGSHRIGEDLFRLTPIARLAVTPKLLAEDPDGQILEIPLQCLPKRRGQSLLRTRGGQRVGQCLTGLLLLLRGGERQHAFGHEVV